MLLIGMYDSPFVRRVAVALRLYGIAFEHQPWSVFRDADKVAQYNPLIRVPTLVIDDGDALVDSSAIIDALDDIVGPAKALMPADGPERRKHTRICALACGLGDKIVSLIYERMVHQRQTPDWVARCERQIDATLDALEQARATRAPATSFGADSASGWWFGETITHADIAVACVLTLAVEALQFNLDDRRWPALKAHREKCEALPEFREISQPFFSPPTKPT